MTSDDLKDKLGRFSLIDPTITWRTDQFPHREAYARIEELEAENQRLQAWQNASFLAHPNIDLDIEAHPEACAALEDQSDE